MPEVESKRVGAATLDPEDWRSDLLELVLRAGLILGGVTYVPSVAAAFYFGFPGVVVVDTIAMGFIVYLALSSSRSFRFRAVSFSFVMYVLGAWLMLSVGSISQIYLLGFSLLTTLLLGLRAGLTTVAINVVTMLLIGYFGFASPEMVVGKQPHNFTSWVVVTLNFLLMNLLLTLALGSVIRALERALQRAMAVNQSLRSKDALLGIAGQTARLGGWTLDLPDVRFVWSDEVCALHEVPLGTAPTLDQALHFHSPASRAVMNEAMQCCIEEGVPFDVETEILTARGNRLWCRSIGRAVRDENDVVTRVHGSFQDVTARKRADQEREKLEEQLRQAQKMDAVGRLAGGVAHDFNNMLGVILGHAQFLRESIPYTDPRRADLDPILEAGERSSALTNQLLAFARQQTISPRVIDLNATIQNTLKMLTRLIGEDVELIWRPGVDVGSVKIDPSQLDQILANLAVNARHAITSVGTLSLETRVIFLDEEALEAHSGTTPGPYVVLRVSDSGRGMDPATLARLFEPFFTTKEVGQGTGLGLATVYGIVRQNQGFIEVTSAVGQGTTFHIHLPQSESASGAASRRDDSSEPPRGVETILLVEDEAPLLRLGQRLLEFLGYKVLAASGPDVALALAAQHESIDILVTDVIMPSMTGRDVWQILRKTRPQLPCLFVSGYTADVIAHRGVLDDGVHFLQKPFTIEQLAFKVRRVLDENQSLRTDRVAGGRA